MRQKLARGSACFLPLACLLAAFFGKGDLVRWMTAGLVPCWLFCLCMPDAFRRAAAGEPSLSRVRGLWTAAFLWTLIGTVLFYGLVHVSGRSYLAFFGGTGVLTLLFCEHMRVKGQAGSAGLCLTLRAMLIFTAAVVAPETEAAVWLCIASGVSLLLSSLVAFTLAGNPFGLPRGRVFGSVPAAAFKKALYFAPAVLLLARLLKETHGILEGVLLGWAVFALSETTFRRAQLETAPFNVALLLPAALVLGVLPRLPLPFEGMYVCMAALWPVCWAAVAAICLFAAKSWRMAAAVVLLPAGCFAVSPLFTENPAVFSVFLSMNRVYAPIAVAVLLVALLLPDFRALALRRRVPKK